jgi:hypothetical protein
MNASSLHNSACFRLLPWLSSFAHIYTTAIVQLLRSLLIFTLRIQSFLRIHEKAEEAGQLYPSHDNFEYHYHLTYQHAATK